MEQALTKWIDEYHQGVRYGLEGRVIVNETSNYQEITIIESHRYGKGLLLDGCWMTAEKADRHYHEPLVHPALCGAKKIEKVLIIGGGDGGTARECLRYKEVKQLDMIEIDNRVIELSKQYLPNIGGMAWNDSRLNLQISDGIEWVSNSIENSYDVIIVDGSDPIGPAKGLFNKRFLKNCMRILNKDGIFATQSESPESFREIHLETIKLIREIFNCSDTLYGCVPIYPSGWWSWTFATKDHPSYQYPMQTRSKLIESQCDIWSPKWQLGGFQAMPAFIKRELEK